MNECGRSPPILKDFAGGMNIELPLYRQEKTNTCGLACLRMVLGAFGTEVTEATIEAQARMERRGILINELERLARHFHLVAGIQDTTVEELQKILADGKLPIAFIDRVVFDLTPEGRRTHSIRDAIIHTVIPTQVTAKSVTYHDPRQGQVTRKTIRLFHRAYMGLGGRCVVCSKQ
jgi:ABC-type bacteriocin/lantibiotic exporter with double-glycine peptidase domain